MRQVFGSNLFNVLHKGLFNKINQNHIIISQVSKNVRPRFCKILNTSFYFWFINKQITKERDMECYNMNDDSQNEEQDCVQ